MNFDLNFYWSLFLRRLPVMTGLFLLCAGVGVIVALKLPPTFTTSARLLVEAPKIQVDSAVGNIGAAEQLQVIEQQLMTRANLIDIAHKWNVFEEIDEMTPDRIHAQMRANTRIRRTGGRGQATLMSISFEARSGRVAANVVNEYVTLVLEANNEFRIGRAEGTLAFYQQEVDRLETELDTQSGRIVQFKNTNSEALPDDLTLRQGRYAVLQERIDGLERDRAGIMSQRNEMIAIFQATGRLQGQPNPQRTETQDERLLRELERNLAEALTVFSETHPRVIQIKTRIEQLEKRVAELNPIPVSDGAEEGGTGSSLLDLSLSDMDRRLRMIDETLVATREEQATLGESITATAANAIALGNLEREHENIQRQYNAAVRELNEARVNERIELNSQGQRIRPIENANIPQEPSGPGRTRIAAMGVGAGLGLAAAYFVLLELLNRTIRRPSEIRAHFGIVPIATISYIESRREKFARRAVMVSAFMFMLISVPTALYVIDTYYMPLEILANKVMQRIGIG